MQMVLGILAVGADLASLLGVRYVPGDPAHSGPVGRLIESALLAHNRGDHLRVEIELLRLRMLLKHLRETKEFDEPTFNRLRNRLVNETTPDYHGVRQEVLVAARLSREQVPFLHERRGRPDFILKSDEAVGIECTSVHFRKETDDPVEKICPAIEGKRNKSYAGPSVALAIGVTEIFYRTGLVDNELRAAASKAVAETPYGAALLFTEVFLRDKGEYHSLYIREDARSISPGLRRLVDSVWPKGNLGDMGRWAISGGH
jgi:hypothetical protein